MLRLVQALFLRFVRWALRLRYRVEVVGLEQLREIRGPTLIMPNHPGYIDPPLVLTHVKLHRPVRPVVYAGMYRRPTLYPFMRLVEALEVPDLAEHSHGARKQTLAMIDAVVAGLKRGECFLIYPSGHVQRRSRGEEIGSARAVSEILERAPEVNLVLVRIRGLWGSMFTFARTGNAPSLGRCALVAIGWMLANLLFFAPRRCVTMTVRWIDRGELPGVEREKLNPHLEAWYNADGLEAPTFVPRHPFLGPREFQFPDLEAGGGADLAKVKPATIRAVNEMIEEYLGNPLSDEEQRPEATLDEIGLDSIDRMDLALKIEDRFGFRSDRVANTLGELWALANGLASSTADVPIPVPPAWNRPPSSHEPVDILGETVAEALVRRALRHPGDVAVADRVSGALSYRRLLVAARLLGKRLGELPGSAIGVLLPASVAADVTFFGLHLAGKLPVMLNWTTGPGNLAHALKTLDIRSVVTSRKLIDRLGIEVEGADYVFLEDLRGQVGKLAAAALLAASYLAPGRFLRDLLRPDADDPAVVLFTSGSESAPKAVPLSHRNLLSNARASLAVLGATRADAVLAFLPPFHSFGLTGNVMAPVLGGIRAVYHPDPTDAAGLVRTTAQYRATILVTTPTFLGYMFAVAKPDDLASLRMIVTGAEKCPEAIFDRARRLAPQAMILEGYGITECSPVVSGNRAGGVKPGTVGQPVDGVEVCVVDPESKRPLPPNTIGMLLVRGPSVFRGYLNYRGPDPFVEIDGKRWYSTGDLVELDEERYIHFRGRLKRFLKAAGEMISLPALEEPLARLYPPTENGPQVAVEGIETPDGRWIVLFTTRGIPLRQANAALAEAGLRGVMRIDEVLRVDAIPVLGSGKTDYKVLRRMVAERVQAVGKDS